MALLLHCSLGDFGRKGKGLYEQFEELRDVMYTNQ